MLWTTPLLRRSAAALTLTLLLGGCMSDKKEANAPLPRMSKEKAEEWAKHWTDSMTRTAKATLDPKTAKPTADYSNCTGKNGESADDGRFTLHYSVRATLPRAQHAKAIRAIRDTLEEQGFKIQGYRSDPSKDPANLVDATHPKEHHFVSAGDVAEDLLVLIVATPCLLPPGANQQQF
ncbi:hypothetical protein GCM10010394_45880 [Streptomyces crystallinus]|uniref:Lipoprotein n=2 Tax=Streptomyces crystallinus TaxID=68191 RepID=A0ABN1GG46_9ACTN